MPTLKEAVESGRRWRWANYVDGSVTHRWQGPGIGEAGGLMFSVLQTLGNNFEIEPEPERPREWRVCAHDQTVHSIWPTQPHGYCNCGEAPSGQHVRVHDADACDRLHKS